MSMTEEDRQAFFRLMDEYLESRPHLQWNLAGAPTSTPAPAPPSLAAGKKAPPPPPPRHTTTKSAESSPVESLTTSLQQTHVARSSGPQVPAGLTRGKAIGNINTTSKQSMLTSTAGLATSKVLNTAKNQVDYYTGKASQQDENVTPSARSTGQIQPPPYRSAASELGEAVALYPYVCAVNHRFVGTQSGDLSMVQDERITLLEQVTPDWFRARSADGTREGIVPANYVQRV
ncbi:hypothetical protein MNAN1_002384 [Malassezia nana]|uniref:SH3 domain-containing protein n=1 Tax=Malassezia nana TaxID=180528 RepID=A0AAF0EL43_9BASI|nr:hypothetical protein MNAN1_002384 [Malassezia nana]